MIKLKYESEDQIPDGKEDLYEERDGEWVLTGVEGMKTQADMDRVNEAAKKERGLKREAEKKLRAYEKLGDLDEITEKLDRFPELETLAEGKADDEKIQELAEKRAQRQIAPLQRELDALKETNTDLTEKVTSYETKDRNRKIEDAARAAAMEAKVQDTAIDDVLMYARSEFTVDEDGTIISQEGVQPKDWLADMQSKKPHWWPPSQGGGAPGGGDGGPGGNPLKGDTPNLTEFGKIARTNPKRADALAKQAGRPELSPLGAD